MGRRFLLLAGFIYLLTLMLSTASGFAQEEGSGISQWINEFGVFGGYTKGDLKFQDDLESVPIGLRIGFDLKPFTSKFNFEPKGYLQYLVEPFIGTITSPEANLEFGVGNILRYSYPLTEKFYPFVEAGIGMCYMTQHTYEQSTQFNFFELGGVGLSFFFKDNVALNTSYRFRHISNASIEHPNGGIESHLFLVGCSYYY